ncbi:hypothetical protein LCGC14_0474620 [marine sediment metagenome]|uniref:Uncharacterized protein n=1 Tax=marine sediment metagenome TaxID=412755 RepID=A0A0F9SU68_9ZZZZ
MEDLLLGLRHKLERFVDTLGGKSIGAGTNLLTGEVDFSFDLGEKTYSVRIAEIKLERR